MFAGTSLTEECVETIVTTTDSFVTGHQSIGLDTVLQAVQFPAGVTDLDTSLTDMDGDTFTLQKQMAVYIVRLDH